MKIVCSVFPWIDSSKAWWQKFQLSLLILFWIVYQCKKILCCRSCIFASKISSKLHVLSINTIPICRAEFCFNLPRNSSGLWNNSAPICSVSVQDKGKIPLQLVQWQFRTRDNSTPTCPITVQDYGKFRLNLFRHSSGLGNNSTPTYPVTVQD